MAKIVALKRVWYAGREREVGDEFDCAERDTVMIWTAKDLPGGPIAKLAEEKPRPAPPPEKPRLLEAAAITAEPLEPPEPTELLKADGTPDRRRRYYRRNDMKAEGE